MRSLSTGLAFLKTEWFLSSAVASGAKSEKAQPVVRANAYVCHASCRATSRASHTHGSPVTFGKDSFRMKPKRLEEIIARGKMRYILLYGVLGWGLSTAALGTCWSYYTNEKMSTADVVRPFVIFSMGGVLWGAFMWSFIQKKHRDAQSAG